MIHRSEIFGFDTVMHTADICIIGAGAGGLFAAVAAARHGAKVALMHDRPMVGGNASSEVRMWIRGAHGRDRRETGIVEELALANLRRNPTLNFSIWDSVTYELVKNEPNIDLMLNCSCMSAEMDGDSIVSVTGWQTTTQKFHKVESKIFADCSGDSVLAPLTGAEFRMGREARGEFNEDISPETADARTMGMSCLFQVRETDRPVPYKAPDWAEKFTDETIGHRVNFKNPHQFKGDNFWWMELGGEYDSIGDTEMLRDKLLAIAFGVWDYYKNSGHFDAANWELDWVGFLPGKRESRRYVGDYILTQNDVRMEGRFEDIIAYGGWTMDDHHPGGFAAKASATIFHRAPSPFGIPYRCLYSKNIANLMFAGRNISCTHAATSACRVMATCATIGQAMGTAAAIAIANDTSPRGVYMYHLKQLKQMLMEDDCWLPFNKRAPSSVMAGASAKAGGIDAAVIFDGCDRTVGGESHLCSFPFGEELVITLPEMRGIREISFIFDSDINRDSFVGVNPQFRTYPLRCNRWLHEKPVGLPATLMRDFDLWYENENGWHKLASVTDNYRRKWTLACDVTAKQIKLVPKCAYGADTARLYSVVLK
ncbi:MAG: FAD-dependent oxidoreductase [Ruminococcaceae bacterium]|nr:FAD-dependent oxidoreductase [Oscillospiraceae bacterium]